MSLKDWLERQAPDFVETWRRFPLAIVLAALNTVLVLAAINGLEWVEHDVWGRAAFGLATGAVLAVAGVYFAESRPEAKRWGLFLKYALPLVAIAAFQITDIAWFVPYALPAVAILWLSVSPFTCIERGVPREEQQRRFWLINHQALATAAIAAGAFALIALGFLAIERSMSILFGLDTGWLFYKGLLPFTALFLAPVYWLSTLPRLDELHAEATERPEFIGKAVGFLGQFILVPLLFIYALILLAYTAQIAITRHLPEGMIGWMVMGFVIVGAATWLVLFPPFMRDKPLARLFRRLWFWLTLIPLGLFFTAVWVRVDAYGLTAERMLLLAGGIWALALAIIFLFRRGDIRIIPALAAAILLLLSIGPWNYVNLPVQQQSARLEALLATPGADGAGFPPAWSPKQVVDARSAIDFLRSDENGRQQLARIFAPRGITVPTDTSFSRGYIMEALGYPETSSVWEPSHILFRDEREDIDLSATPLLLAHTYFVFGAAPKEYWLGETEPPLHLWLAETAVMLSSGAGPPQGIDLSGWIALQTGETITRPWLDFEIAGRRFRLVVDRMEMQPRATEPPVLSTLEGTLAVSALKPSP